LTLLSNRRRYRASLATVRDVRRELTKVYRESRSGRLDAATACKLGVLLQSIYRLILLQSISRLIETEEFERGIRALKVSNGD
jgi:hypothetical protein